MSNQNVRAKAEELKKAFDEEGSNDTNTQQAKAKIDEAMQLLNQGATA